MNQKIIQKSNLSDFHKIEIEIEISKDEKIRHEIKSALGAIEMAVSVIRDNYDNKIFTFEILSEIEKKCQKTLVKIDKLSENGKMKIEKN
ncbi:MAG: hypothetical protein HQK49_06620 [Oligoflexia bacterium]|nr:hypothetical protein [Oligoflexia bacterium]